MAVSDQRLVRRIEAARLIGLAKGMLSEPDEEIAVIYLDHAIEALHMAAEANPISSPIVDLRAHSTRKKLNRGSLTLGPEPRDAP